MDTHRSTYGTRLTSGWRNASQPLSPRLLSRVFHQPSLLYFNAVADCSSVREAARQLNVASSAVTRQILQLEAAIGIDLFQREGRRLKLSPAGESLYRHTRLLSAGMEAAVSDLALLRGLKTGIVRVATVESVGLAFLPSVIAAFGAKYPRLHLDIGVMPSAEVMARITERRADVGFTFLAGPARGVEISTRRDVPIGAVMRPDHPLAAAPALTLAVCIEHPFVVAKPEISIREIIEPLLGRTVATLPPFVEADSIHMLAALAQTGRYVSIMTPIGVQREIESGTLTFRPLADPDLPRNRFGIIVRAGGYLGFAPAAFFDFARQQFEAASLPGAIT